MLEVPKTPSFLLHYTGEYSSKNMLFMPDGLMEIPEKRLKYSDTQMIKILVGQILNTTPHHQHALLGNDIEPRVLSSPCDKFPGFFESGKNRGNRENPVTKMYIFFFYSFFFFTFFPNISDFGVK